MTTRVLFVVVGLLIASHAFAQQPVTTTISTPPATAAVGSSFSIAETVWNGGTSPTAAGTQTLSLVPVGGGTVLILGTRHVPALQSGASSAVTTIVTISHHTPAGMYVVGAGSPGCAGNCLKSVGTIAIIACKAGRMPCDPPAKAPNSIARPPKPQVTVSVLADCGGGMCVSFSGGLELNFFSHQYFQDCRPQPGLACETSGDAGSVFVFTAVPLPGWVFAGWLAPGTPGLASYMGCTGTPTGAPGSNGLRVVASTNLTCVAKFRHQ